MSQNGNGQHSAYSLDQNAANLAFIEALFEDYLQDPDSVSEDWRSYFAGVSRDNAINNEARFHTTLSQYSLFNPPSFDRRGPVSKSGKKKSTMLRSKEQLFGKRVDDSVLLQDKVDQIVRAYRVRGHMHAKLDPLGIPRPEFKELDPAFYGLTDEHLDMTVSTTAVHGPAVSTVRDILDRLRNTYCRSIGVQYMHIDDWDTKDWLQKRMEGSENRLQLTRDEHMQILTRLTDAVMFEEFIQRKFRGAKSFSLEGGESLIPLLELSIELAAEQGVNEIVLAMAHRGRLNVLANIMGKSPSMIFKEFQDMDPIKHGGHGDVKYHMGYSSDYRARGGKDVHLSLCFNASHLECVNPIALGRIRAKQDHHGDADRERGFVILVHGDAAFIGEGVTQETFNLSELPGYRTGGTLHVVVNNQIGFTTSPHQSRSTQYCTDVAKMMQIPIFHVNGEDPEAVAQCVSLAMDFRAKFKRDVVIDMYCYRRRGHNEGDEPSFTQPKMYEVIRNRKPVREGYLDHLMEIQSEITRQDADEVMAQRREYLEAQLSASQKQTRILKPSALSGLWSGYIGGPENLAPKVDTRITRERAAELLTRLSQTPDGFTPHDKIQRVLDGRAEMAQGNKPLDWGGGEALAFSSLATDGFPIRVSGQDVQRGTFAHRHGVVHDVNTGDEYESYQFITPDQAPVRLINSPLSEVAVLGFEYGYSLDTPDGLVIWEAQFGDFANVAQLIFDQFIFSAEEKWNRLSGLVVLLPHGFEGMGPEHSSARLERFLAMAVNDNMQIANLTTPAQYYHILRRQVLRKWPKPLIIMSPKSLLRHPAATSTLEDITEGVFQKILPDDGTNKGDPSLVLLCSGKLYYELAKYREEQGRDDVAILRVEQLYPLLQDEMMEALSQYPEGTQVVWVQEEPQNMGAWKYIHLRFDSKVWKKYPLIGVSRPPAASPATGSPARHKYEQERLIKQAFGDEEMETIRDAW